MLYSCPNHELSREIVIQNVYARLSQNDRSMLDTSCVGSFMKKLLNSGGISQKELNATLKIGNSMKVNSQVLNLSMIMLNLL